LHERRTAFGCCGTDHLIVTVGGSFWQESAASGAPEKHFLSTARVLRTGSAQWGSIPDFPVAVDYALVVAVPPRVYVTGGQNSSGQMASTRWLAIDDRTLDWEMGPNLPRPMSRLRGGVWHKTIVAITDESAEPGTANQGRRSRVIAWDTEEPSGTWQELSVLPDPDAAYRAAAVCGDRLFVFGGATPKESDQLQLSDKVWSYCLSTNRWQQCNSLPSAIRDATALKLGENHIAIAGGVEEAVGPGLSPDQASRIVLSSRCTIFDTVRNRFSASKRLPLATADHGLAVLDGKIYVVGGEDSPYRTRTDLVQCCDVQELLAEAEDDMK
jgi:N-acetylneuraminic acid mutarotase